MNVAAGCLASVLLLALAACSSNEKPAAEDVIEQYNAQLSALFDAPDSDLSSLKQVAAGQGVEGAEAVVRDAWNEGFRVSGSSVVLASWSDSGSVDGYEDAEMVHQCLDNSQVKGMGPAPQFSHSDEPFEMQFILVSDGGPSWKVLGWTSDTTPCSSYSPSPSQDSGGEDGGIDPLHLPKR